MFRRRSSLLIASICLAPFAGAWPAAADSRPEASSTRALQPDAPLDVALYDRTAGRMLPLYVHHGAIYVAGEPRHEYEVRLRNGGDLRVLAVTSVDGVNVVTGRTAATDQPGYVVGAWGSVQIDGWRKSLDEVAAFVFTTPGKSYAARTGRPDHVGVIGVAMFREAPRVARQQPLPYAAARDERADAAETQAQRRSGPASSPSSASAADAASEGLAAKPGLGTGHGARHDSQVVQTSFERASDAPEWIVQIYYDSYRNLVARGVIEPEPALVRRRPQAFPAGGFVADP